MWLSSGVLILIIATAILVGFAYFQARDVFWGDNDWRRELRRYRRLYLRRFPLREQVSTGARLLGALKRIRRDQALWHEAVEEITDGREAYQYKVRDEIDRLVGKDVYHGQKEQL